jgi:hypothetical protein
MWGEGKWILMEGNFPSNEEEVVLRGLNLAGCSVGGARCDRYCFLGAHIGFRALSPVLSRSKYLSPTSHVSDFEVTTTATERKRLWLSI